MGIDDFKGSTPEFLPEEYFAGKLEGWGVLESLVGGLQKRCTITAEGSWDDATQTVTFTETYIFDDGHRDTLHWKLGSWDRVSIRERSLGLITKVKASKLAARITGNTHETRLVPTALRQNSTLMTGFIASTIKGALCAALQGEQVCHSQQRMSLIASFDRVCGLWPDGGNRVYVAAITAGRAALVARADDFTKRLVPILQAVRTEGADTLRSVAEALNRRGVKSQRWELATKAAR